MNTFISEIVDDCTYIHLDKIPNFDDISKLNNFLARKNGNFISTDKKSFRINRKFSSGELQILFKENRFKFFTKENFKAQSNDDFKRSSNCDDLESIIVNFGQHKGKTYGELDKNYLTWLKESHFDKKVKEIAAKVLEIQNVVYIDMSKYR